MWSSAASRMCVRVWAVRIEWNLNCKLRESCVGGGGINAILSAASALTCQPLHKVLPFIISIHKGRKNRVMYREVGSAGAIRFLGFSPTQAQRYQRSGLVEHLEPTESTFGFCERVGEEPLSYVRDAKIVVTNVSM